MIDKILVLIKKFLLNVFNNHFKSLEHKIKYEILTSNLQDKAMNSVNSGISDEKYCENDIIISLTSYASRVQTVHLTIESLLNQTIKPNKIILWLNAPYNSDNIPQILKKQINRGLEVKFAEDYKSYGKLIHSLINYPNDTIITCDDDVLYPYDFVEKFVQAHCKDKTSIYFYHGSKMTLTKDNQLMPYKFWDENVCSGEDSVFHFPFGNCGILYPPKSLNKEVLNTNAFVELAPFADDIWFRAMSLLNNTPCKKIAQDSHPFDKMIAISSAQNVTLWQINLSKNDEQIKNVFSKYNIYQKLNIKP